MSDPPQLDHTISIDFAAALDKLDGQTVKRVLSAARPGRPFESVGRETGVHPDLCRLIVFIGFVAIEWLHNRAVDEWGDYLP